MPNDTRTGLKFSGNTSYGGMNPPKGLDLKNIEADPDNPKESQKKKKKAANIQRRALECLKTAYRNYK